MYYQCNLCCEAYSLREDNCTDKLHWRCLTYFSSSCYFSSRVLLFLDSCSKYISRYVDDIFVLIFIIIQTWKTARTAANHTSKQDDSCTRDPRVVYKFLNIIILRLLWLLNIIIKLTVDLTRFLLSLPRIIRIFLLCIFSGICITRKSIEQVTGKMIHLQGV